MARPTPALDPARPQPETGWRNVLALAEALDLSEATLRIEADLAEVRPGTRFDLWLGEDGGLAYRSALGRDADAELARRLADPRAESSAGAEHLYEVARQADGQRCIARIETTEWNRVESRWHAWLPALRLRLPALLHLDRLNQRVRRLEQNERRQRALFAITDLSSTAADMPELARGLHHIVGQLMYAQNFYIARYDAHRATVRFLYYADERDPNPPDDREQGAEVLTHSLTGGLIRHGRPLHGSSTALLAKLGITDDRAFCGPDAYDWLGVPMLSGAEVKGVVVVQSYDPARYFTHHDRELLVYVAQHILTSLERWLSRDQLESQVEQRTHELRREVRERERGERLQRALFNIAERSVTSPTPEAFYADVHRELGGLLYARNFFVALLSADRSELTFPYSADEYDARRPPRRLAKGLSEYVLRQQRAILADRAEIDRLARCGEVHSFGTRSVCWLGVPLFDKDEAVGVLAVQSYSESHTYTPQDLELLTFVAHHIGTGLERKRVADALRAANLELEARVAERTNELATANRELRAQIAVRERVERQLKHEALHDVLTGLPNRAFLLQRLDAALARPNPHRFAVMFLDLDRFKVINDSVGHMVGDEMLKQAGARIAACLGPLDLVARLGGDEFAVLVEDGRDVDAVERLARRLIESLNAPMRLSGKELFTAVSIGIALSDPRYTRPEELLRDADVAMYRAKGRGRKRFEWFDQQLHTEALRLLDLESDLRRALSRGEFEPFFQPIVALQDASVQGYEALLRWRHGERGLLVPADFLSVAEDTGAVEEIDWQLFERAMRGFARLSRGQERVSQYVALNVSGRHFRTPDFAERFLDLLRRAPLDPTRVRVEVTEGMLLEKPDLVRRTLESLREAGVLAQLDDFGTGYSSLSYLHRFPLHALKIDRSFVADLDGESTGGSQAVVRAILALARSLNLEVIAEGIQRESERQHLLAMGCTLGQGFLFARPAGVDELAA